MNRNMKQTLPLLDGNACERSLLSAHWEQVAAGLLGCLLVHVSNEQTFPNLKKLHNSYHHSSWTEFEQKKGFNLKQLSEFTLG